MEKVCVDLGNKDRKVCRGVEIRALGGFFRLKEIYEENTFQAVFFRTESGNIYLLDQVGKIADVRTSKPQRKIVKEKLSKRFLNNTKLKIGEIFENPSHTFPIRTTSIVEIVAIKGDYHQTKELKERGYRANNISLDFLNLVGIKDTISNQR